MIILTGTSGYDYKDWKGVFYDESISRKEYPAFYSRFFSTVELNFTYYRMPTPDHLRDLFSRFRNDMIFSIKSHKSLTHEVDGQWKEQARLLMDATEVLGENLGAVLFQFPFSFHYTKENRRYLDLLLRETGAFPIVVEFRNGEWLNRRVFDGLRDRNTGFCCTDMPQLKGLPASLDMVTGDIGYIRFHGRNKESWWTGNSAERYNYLYSREELESWVPRIEEMALNTKKFFIYFNNHWGGRAAENARMMQELLGEA